MKQKKYIHCFSPLSFHSIFVFHRSWVAIYFRLSSILKFNIIFVTQYDSKCVRTSRDWPTYAEKFKVFWKESYMQWKMVFRTAIELTYHNIILIFVVSLYNVFLYCNYVLNVFILLGHAMFLPTYTFNFILELYFLLT